MTTKKKTTDSLNTQLLLFFCGLACVFIGFWTFHIGGWQELLETHSFVHHASSRFPQSGLVLLLFGMVLSFFTFRNVLRLMKKKKSPAKRHG